jgi:hypothetical protein
MQFELVDHRVALRDDRLVLRRVNAAKALRKDFFRCLAKQPQLVFQAAARSQRTVHEGITRLRVLHEENDIRHRVKDRLQQPEMLQHGLKRRSTRGGSKRGVQAGGRGAVFGFSMRRTVRRNGHSRLAGVVGVRKCRPCHACRVQGRAPRCARL